MGLIVHKSSLLSCYLLCILRAVYMYVWMYEWSVILLLGIKNLKFDEEYFNMILYLLQYQALQVVLGFQLHQFLPVTSQ